MPRVLAVLLGIAALGCTTLQGARLYERGTQALEAGDSARAIADLERAAELVPHASEVQNNLGIAYLEAGRRDDARAAFERAVALDCSNAAAHDNLDLLRGEPTR